MPSFSDHLQQPWGKPATTAIAPRESSTINAPIASTHTSSAVEGPAGEAHGPRPQDAVETVKNESLTALSEVASVRDLARRNVIAALLPQKDAIFAERNKLALMQFNGGLTPGEQQKLTYLRWLLDRIEDAENGPHLDMLERLVVEQRRLAQEVAQALQSVLRSVP